FRETLDAGEGRAKLVADDRHEVAFRSVQALELDDRGALALEGLGRGDRDPELLRHGLDETDVVGRPLPGAIHLRERERACELASDADGRARWATRLTSASRSARASASLTESALCMEPATYWPMIIGSWTLSAMRSPVPSPMRRSAPTSRSREMRGSAAKDLAVPRAGSSSTTFFHISRCASSSTRRSDCRWSITRVRTTAGSATLE